MIFRTWVAKTDIGIFKYRGNIDSSYYFSYSNYHGMTSLRGIGILQLVMRRQ